MSDLFNMGWLSGNIDAIAPVADVIGTICMCVISIIGFAIVMSSIIKNSVHGLYASNTKLWDRVYEVKMASVRSSGGLKGIFNSEAAGIAAGGSTNDVTKFIGTLTALGMSFLPNIKAMTDFEDSVMDVKTYFMKALPAACVVIFIGVFIWLGYPALVAEKFSEFATATVDMVLLNVDPRAWVEKIPGEFAVLNFATDGAKDDVSAFENNISKEAANAVVGAFSSGTITADAKRDTALAVESWVINQCVEGGNSPCVENCDKDKYKLTVSASIYKDGPPPQSTIRNGAPNSEGIIAYVYSTAISDFPTGTNVDISKWYIRLYLEFKPLAVKDSSKTKNLTMETGWTISKGSSNDILEIVVSSQNGCKLSLSGGARAMAGDERVTLSMSGDTLKVSSSSSIDFSQVQELTDVSGVYYVDPNSKSHPIKTIKNTGGGISLIPDDGSPAFSWGELPDDKPME